MSSFNPTHLTTFVLNIREVNDGTPFGEDFVAFLRFQPPMLHEQLWNHHTIMSMGLLSKGSIGDEFTMCMDITNLIRVCNYNQCTPCTK